jgi:DNA-binding LytR/AlgR family response regulator
MKAVIIEDEALVAKDLKKSVSEIAGDFEILAILPSLASARKWFAENPEPDLLFMDIQLSDGVSFDLFKTTKINCPIIFTTAYDEYAIRAFKLNSIDYLLKPIDKHELSLAIEKFRNSRQSVSSHFDDQISAFLKDFTSGDKKKYKERFMVHSGKSLVPILKSNISCFAKEELIFLYTLNNERYLTDFSTMDSLEELLNPEEFYRANRQYIIHADAVTHIKPHFTGKLTIALAAPKNTEIDISREKAAGFKGWMG